MLSRSIVLAAGFTFLGFRFDSSGAAPAQEAYEALAQKLADVPVQDTRREQIQRGWEGYFGSVEEDKIPVTPPSMNLAKNSCDYTSGQRRLNFAIKRRASKSPSEI